jgi:trimethylamine--corrinoid protein Co-methyltransferase
MKLPTSLNHYCEFLSKADVQAIHDTSMKLLKDAGIRFPTEEALSIFQAHGFKTDHQTVYMTEDQVMGAIASVPAQFTIHARNPQREAVFGDGTPIFAPGLGAPFLIEMKTGKRSATLADYENIARLTQALPNQDMSGYLMVMPSDVRSRWAHLDMLLASIRHSDKPLIGSTNGIRGARDSIEMVQILYGSPIDRPVMMGMINPLSPLGYSPDMVEALMIFAEQGQPVTIATLIMAGSTGPITLAGVLAQQNAEIIAGIVLTQLIQAGAPIIYGSTSTNTDMRTGALAIGSPELALCISGHMQLARFYGFPCRGGGALTDSKLTDAQAGFESMFSLLTAVNSGADFILHSGGILSSYMAFSLEKFILDDEMIGMLRRFMGGIEVKPETLAYDVIAKVGKNGHFLEEDHTLARCRTEFWEPTIVDRDDYETWNSNGGITATERAHQRAMDLLEAHQDPPLDEIIERQLKTYVEDHSQGVIDSSI